ncbi:hypothetical protein ACOMHN_005639 [Nucella lapillus]
MPIRCVVEHVNGAVNFDTAGSAPCEVTAVEQDAFAILPTTTPLCDLVRAALAKLGYSATDAVNAKGAIQLKNWKPLSFDVITDDKDATIDDILRELKEYTLRIRLSSLPRLSSVEEMKEKLLQLLLTTSLSLLMDNGCPVDKNLLMALSKGENLPVAEDTVLEFDSWYSHQLQKTPKIPLSPPHPTSSVLPESTPTSSKGDTEMDTLPAIKAEPEDSRQKGGPVGGEKMSVSSSSSSSSSMLSSSTTAASSSSSSSLSLSVPLTSLQAPPMMMNGVGHFPPSQNAALTSHAPLLTPSKTRIRTSFDPEHEIPRLQRWFQENQHPSREQMVRYMSELNNLDSRRGRRPLDLTNIIYWFKNARAAQRRANKALDESFENEENVDVNVASSQPVVPNGGVQSLPESPSTIPPYLPNKNAVYIVPYPYHTTHPSPSHTLLNTPEPQGDPSDEPCDLSIKKLKDTTSNNQQQDGGAKTGGGGGAAATPRVIKSESGGGGGGVMEVATDLSRNNGGHKAPPQRLSSTAFSDLSRKSGFPPRKDQHSNGDLAGMEERKRREKHYLKEAEERDEQRLVMDLREEGDVSSDDSGSSDLESSRGGLGVKNHRGEEEMDYVTARARAELGMGMSRLAAAAAANSSESSAASMAALSLAQMSQPPLQIPISPLNPLAMYYNMPPFYHHHSSPHHSQTSAAATAAMVAAFGGSAHLNGHHNTAAHPSTNPCSTSTSGANPQSAASGGRPPPIQSSPHHLPTSRCSEPRKRRTRVFIDPLTEIPKLEKWFTEDTHPSAYMIDKYTETLNSAEYRQKFPRLEPKNIQLWFKNHRAKVKRQRTGVGDDSMGDSPPPAHLHHQGSRSTTPVLGLTLSKEGSGSAGSGSPEDHPGSSKHSDDLISHHPQGEEEMEVVVEEEQ